MTAPFFLQGVRQIASSRRLREEQGSHFWSLVTIGLSVHTYCIVERHSGTLPEFFELEDDLSLSSHPTAPKSRVGCLIGTWKERMVMMTNYKRHAMMRTTTLMVTEINLTEGRYLNDVRTEGGGVKNCPILRTNSTDRLREMRMKGGSNNLKILLTSFKYGP